MDDGFWTQRLHTSSCTHASSVSIDEAHHDVVYRRGELQAVHLHSIVRDSRSDKIRQLNVKRRKPRRAAAEEEEGGSHARRGALKPRAELTKESVAPHHPKTSIRRYPTKKQRGQQRKS